MSYGACPAHAWTISVENLRKLVPKEYDELIAQLEKSKDDEPDSLDLLAESFRMEEEVPQDTVNAFEALIDAFKKATEVYRITGTSSLDLFLDRYDADMGGPYDDLEDGHYWAVGNVECKTPAGEQFANVLEEKTWVQYG